MSLPIISEEADPILSVGTWLGPEHRNWALTREQALTAISRLHEASLILLGGDVLKGPEENFVITYDNWYYEPSTPPVPDDLSSSAQKASSYVKSYPVNDAYFVLVARSA